MAASSYSDPILAAHCAKAVAAVNRPVPSGPEGNHGVGAALGAHRRVHFPGGPTIAAPRLIAPGVSTVGTPFGLIGVAPGSEELLLPNGEHELCVTVRTRKIFVYYCHLHDLQNCVWLSLGHPMLEVTE